jgi:hypothetical protein
MDAISPNTESPQGNAGSFAGRSKPAPLFSERHMFYYLARTLWRSGMRQRASLDKCSNARRYDPWSRPVLQEMLESSWSHGKGRRMMSLAKVMPSSRYWRPENLVHWLRSWIGHRWNEALALHQQYHRLQSTRFGQIGVKHPFDPTLED